MIYDQVSPDDPIRQGDIFESLPRVRVPLCAIPIIETGSRTLRAATWQEIVNGVLKREEHAVAAALQLAPVSAIVITQDCDAVREPELSLCEIKPFEELEPDVAKSLKARVGAITKNARKNYKWFYLPPDASMGFGDMMGVDFRCTMRLAREELERYRHLRRGRLSPVAYDHFRERLAHFFRRYAYNEWYPLRREEMEYYAQQSHEPVEWYPWQEGNA